jgi:hypothetical protein
MGERVFVDVVYATADLQETVRVPYEPGLTAERAVQLSRLAERFPEIRAHALVLGVFGKRVARGRMLAPGDRVEICRPLVRDPRERRREIAFKKPVKG